MFTCHLQPIVSAKKPPRGAPAACPDAKTTFATPCHVPLLRNGMMSDMRMTLTLKA